VTSPADRAGTNRPRGTPIQRGRVAGLRLVSWLARLLPDRVAIGLADLAGDAWHRAAPGRREQAARNLARVAGSLAERGVGPKKARDAAHDRRELNHLVREAFRHDARYYLEVLRVPSLTPAILDEQVTVERPEVVEDAFSGGPVIFASPHFGPIELPALYLARRTGRTFVAPMETVDDPPLQGWFERTRGSLGVRIVGLRAARRELRAALEADGYVGIVADRDVGGGGIDVPFFGHPAPFPIGPALLAIETGARIFAVGVRRLPNGRYAGGLRHVPVAAEGGRRQRIEATLRELAAAFEAIIAEAPEQWSGAFFPIWSDLAVAPPETTKPTSRARSNQVPPS
jgi:phosphatidylinositol dimannoside acyltransferase